MRCAELACAFTSNLCASKSGFGLSERRQSQGQGQVPGRTGEESSRWRRRLPQVLRQLHGSLEAAEPPGEVDPAIPVALTLTGLCCGLWSLLARLNAQLADEVTGAKTAGPAREARLAAARALAGRCKAVFAALTAGVTTLGTLSASPPAERAVRAWAVAMTGPGGRQELVDLLGALRDDPGCSAACREAARRLLLDLEHGKKARELTRRQVTCLAAEPPRQAPAYPQP